MVIDFETWKAEFKPRIYQDSGAECYDHEVCSCEFLYTVELSELADDDDDRNAEAEQRLWSWQANGLIVSGVTDLRADLLITEKPWSKLTMVK